MSARSIVIAAGGEPVAPPIPGLEQVDYLTSDTLWEIADLPGRLLVLGGGPIGCELAQSFARLGSEVTLVEMGDRLLSREDKYDVTRKLTLPKHSPCLAHLKKGRKKLFPPFFIFSLLSGNYPWFVGIKKNDSPLGLQHPVGRLSMVVF